MIKGKRKINMGFILFCILLITGFSHLAQIIDITRWKTIYRNLDKFEFCIPTRYDNPGEYDFELRVEDKIILRIFTKKNFSKIYAIEKVGDEKVISLSRWFPVFKYRVVQKLKSMVPDEYLINSKVEPDKFENYL